MADLYSIIPGLTPTAQELLEAELLCKQILEAKFKDLDLREGTALRDLVLRPSAMLFALCKKGNDYYFSQHTLKGVNDVTPTDLVDSILSNWFLTRNIGIRSVINARLYFARRKNVAISNSVYFSTDNVLKFYPTDSSSFSSGSLVYDSYSNEYYVDIDMVAESEGTAYNIGSGSLLYFANFDPYFLRAEINFLKSESINSETNTEFINRAKNAISTRNLINDPSIDARLREAFNYIRRLVTVGMGDPDMIRDQIKAVFEDQEPRVVESMTSEETTVTVVMSNHGFNQGQRISVSNADPVTYNGEYLINVIDASRFTYQLSESAPVVTTNPMVRAVNLPVLIHNGGMVDVYCSDKLANAIVQLTTDEFGVAELTGPVYEFSRSSITGGTDEDTIPVLNSSAVSAITITGTSVSVTTTLPHKFLLSDKVTISGAVTEKLVTALTCVGTEVTATVTSHGYLVGNTITISGATPEEYNGTFTITAKTTNSFKYSVAANIPSDGSGAIKSTINLLNGTHTLTTTSGSSFAFTLSQAYSGAVSGTIIATSPVPYTVSNPYRQRKSAVSLAAAGKTVTVNLPRHGYTAGRYITVEASAVEEFNGDFRIVDVPNPDQFTYNITDWINDTSTSGLITHVTPWYDYGFSQRQMLKIDFGPEHANKTVSLNINYFQNLNSIQDYLDSPSNRVLCGDLLARGFNFYHIDLEVTSYNGTAPNSSLVASVATSYLDSLAPGETFIVSDLVTKLRINGVVNIQTPPKITFKKYTRDLSPVETGAVQDFLDPNDGTSVFLLSSVATHAQNITVQNVPVIV